MGEREHGISPHAAQRVLEDRARRLACRPAPTADESSSLEILTFALGEERYGIETRHVREVVFALSLEPIPGSPVLLAGVANLRGEIVAVFDLVPLLDPAGRVDPARSMMLVLGSSKTEFGVLVDAAEDVMLLRSSELREPPHLRQRADRLVLGVTHDALAVLDGERIRGHEQLFIEQDRARGA